MANTEDVSRRFTKIKRPYQQTGVRLSWAEGSDGAWIKKTDEDPHPCAESFVQAFDALQEYVNKPCGHTKAQGSSLTVLGIDLVYNKEGEMRVGISAARALAGFGPPLPINLPHQVPEGLLTKCVEDLEAEAHSYLDGNKGQLELPLEEEESGDDQQELGLEE